MSVDVRALCELAVEAGRHIMAVYESGGPAWTKADDSPLTEADLRAHECIQAGLTKLFPQIPVWSEEGASLAGEAAIDRFFLVDPLDGTKEFLKRNDEFTVNIALIEDGSPVTGVVYAPALDELYFAGKATGAYRRDRHGEAPLRTSAPATPLRVIGSRSHASPALADWIARLRVPHTFVAAGSSLKFCRIAEGQADVYPRHGPTSQWDTAAGQAVLECAGGVVREAGGATLRYGTERPVLNKEFIALAAADMSVPPLL